MLQFFLQQKFYKEYIMISNRNLILQKFFLLQIRHYWQPIFVKEIAYCKGAFILDVRQPEVDKVVEKST